MIVVCFTNFDQLKTIYSLFLKFSLTGDRQSVPFKCYWLNHLALNLQIMDVFNSPKKYAYYIHLYFYAIVTVFIA